MPLDWRNLTRAASLPCSSDCIRVALGDRRQHTVRVGIEREGSIKLWAVVATRAQLGEVTDPHAMAWKRNRVVDLVSFRIDARDRLIGEAWVPTSGLDADEWGFHVRALAEACDRLEFVLTGRDLH